MRRSLIGFPEETGLLLEQFLHMNWQIAARRTHPVFRLIAHFSLQKDRPKPLLA